MRGFIERQSNFWSCSFSHTLGTADPDLDIGVLTLYIVEYVSLCTTLFLWVERISFGICW